MSQVYEFIRAHRHQFDIRQMRRVLEVTHSGYCAWLKHPQSDRAADNTGLPKLIRASLNASNGIYGSPRVFLDLREAGETCSKQRVARLMRANNIRPARGYSHKPKPGPKVSGPISNVLQQQLDVGRFNRVSVTNITSIRSWKRWLYLAVVMDLFLRRIVGRAMGGTIGRGVIRDAVLMVVRRRRPKKVVVHSDHGPQYGRDDWLRLFEKQRRDTQHEPSRQLLGQRRRGGVLLQLEGGGNIAARDTDSSATAAMPHLVSQLSPGPHV
jgi:putative transposase